MSKNIENLPRENIADILQYLDRNELIRATRVSKTFNEVISKSKKLLNKLELIYPNPCNVEWIGTRKYTNLLIQFSITEELIDILKENGKYIKRLNLCHVHGSYSDLQKVLNVCENLKEIWVFEGNFDGDAGLVFEKSFERIFICYHDLKIFSLIKNCQSINLEVNYIREFTENRDFIEFLKNQEDLKGLTVSNTSINILNGLKELKFSHLKLLNTTDLSNLPSTFTTTLQKLSIQSQSTSEFAHLLNDISELEMRSKYLKINQQLDKITKLRLESDDFTNYDWPKFIPNVEQLRLDHFSNSEKAHNPLDLDLKILKSLKHLEINDKYIALILGNMKSLFLKNTRIRSSFFLQSNNQIEYLRVDECRWVNDDFFEHIIDACVKLTTLIIIRVNISSKIIEKINQNCKNLKCFQLINCNVI